MCYAARYRVPLSTSNQARYIDKKTKVKPLLLCKSCKVFTQQINSFNSEIYYEKENYLKVRTAAFKYTTPPIVKRFSTLVRQYVSTSRPRVPTFPHFKFYYVTQLPLVLWFHWFHQFCLSYTDFNPIQVPFQYLYYPAYKVRNTFINL